MTPVLQLDTITNVLLNINLCDRLTLFDSPWGYQSLQRKPIPHSKKSAKENLTVFSAICFSSTSAILAEKVLTNFHILKTVAVFSDSVKEF